LTPWTALVSQSGGIDYLTWSGNISYVSAGVGSADLLLNYEVTANGGLIDLIDQAYTGSAQSGLLAVDETAATGNFGGTVAGYSHLQIGDFSDPPSEAYDNLDILPPQSVLFVTKDIGLAVLSSSGGFITISQVSQSFHQVPEPGTIAIAMTALLLLAAGRRTESRN
jgi:7-keto-8-aminopelargonate synthetase-like enzyme